jgi:gluconolactonase
MKHVITLAVLLGCAGAALLAQSPASTFARGTSQQSWQNPGHKELLAKCKSPAAPFSIPGAGAASANPGPPPEPPVPPASTAIPGVIAGGQSWKVVWHWEGNNADGPIAGDQGSLLFANNDASNVMRLDPATGLAAVVHDKTNTGGALSRSKNGALFLASRGLNAGILQLEPQRKVFASSFRGEPFECVGGVLNDLVADGRGGVYLAITGAGVFYASPQGVVSQQGDGITGANGIILSPDERTLYVTNGPVVLALDVQADGSLKNQREFGTLRGGQGGDGSAVDQQGRLYVATGASIDVFAPGLPERPGGVPRGGEFLGSIPGPPGLHGTAFGGPDKKTLFGIVFYGAWGTPSARNRVIAIPTIAQGYTGRAK